MTQILVELDVSAAQRATRGYAQAQQITRAELESGMAEIGALLEREIKEASPTGATGLLRSAWSNEVLSGESLLDVSARVLNPLIYAAPVEFGTRPHTPPIEPLIDWVNAKLDLQGEDAEDVARRIQFTIRARGTRAQMPAQSTLELQRQQIEDIVGGNLEIAIQRMQEGDR